MLSYRDAPAAIDFLCKAFGFEELMRLSMPDGSIGHAELRYGDSVIMLASEWPDGGVVSPERLERVHSQLTCYVEDVDAHHDVARQAGAVIATAPEDQFYGARMYRAMDTEGHHWLFTQPLRELSPEELQAMVDA